MAGLHLPDRCGVMILPNCSLFPHGGLPLFIFEPRYRRMLEDALNGDCLFAVTRMIGEETGQAGAGAAQVGTIGLVRASREQPDGTSQLLLHGVMRVRFTSWLDERDYPFAEIEPVISFFAPEEQAEGAMKTLKGAVEDVLRPFPPEVRQGVAELMERADNPELLADIVCQQFVQDPDLRQVLLEMESVAARIPLICEYLFKAARDAEDSGAET